MDGFTSSLGNESPFGHKFWQSSHSELFMWDPWKFIFNKFALSGILNVSWLSVPHKYDACTYGHWAWIYAWVCWQCVCVCVHHGSSNGGAMPAILCDNEGRGIVQQFFSHFVKSISTQLLLLLPASYLHSGIIMQSYYTICQDGTQHPAVFYCFQAGPNSVVWLESVFLMDFFHWGYFCCCCCCLDSFK